MSFLVSFYQRCTSSDYDVDLRPSIDTEDYWKFQSLFDPNSGCTPSYISILYRSAKSFSPKFTEKWKTGIYVNTYARSNIIKAEDVLKLLEENIIKFSYQTLTYGATFKNTPIYLYFYFSTADKSKLKILQYGVPSCRTEYFLRLRDLNSEILQKLNSMNLYHSYNLKGDI